MKIERRTLLFVHLQYQSVGQVLTPVNEHDRLLLECGLEFEARLAKMLAKEKKKYTLEMSSREALAFHQLWQILPVSHTGSGMAINAIIGAIDQFRKSPLRQIAEIA